MFSTPPLLYLSFFFPLSTSPVSPSVCISVFHISLVPPPIIQPSSDGYCVRSAEECRERWGLGICLACCTIGTRLSVSNDALIISALELGCCTEWQYQPSGICTFLWPPFWPVNLSLSLSVCTASHCFPFHLHVCLFLLVRLSLLRFLAFFTVPLLISLCMLDLDIYFLC